MQYKKELVDRAKKLRSEGKTYNEISKELGVDVPKSTYLYWFRNIMLTEIQRERIRRKHLDALDKSRKLAVAVNKEKRRHFLESLDQINRPIGKEVHNRDIAKIALAMLCLGEASKSTTSSGFYLGSASNKIIKIFIELLKICFDVDETKFRFTIQCRADQDTDELERYWRGVIGIKNGRFYKTRIDLRTIGKKTTNNNYRGVLRVDYIDKKIQLELESLAEMIYNQLC